MATLDWMLEYSDSNILLDNQALKRICGENLGIQKIRFSDINQVIAEYMSSITAPMRFGGTINQSWRSIHTDMIPYPRIHLLTGSKAPLIPAEQAILESMTVTELAD